MEVSVKIKSETGRVIEYYSHPIRRRTCEVQVNTLRSSRQSLVPTQTAKHTPKKAAIPKRSTPPTVKCVNLPRKKKKDNKAPPKRKVSNKCKACKRIWRSPEDNDFRKKNGLRKTSWIGCDAPKCVYWAHASCAKLLLTPGKSVNSHKFLCPEHKSKK